MELLESKITAMISLALGSMLSGLLPALFSYQNRRRPSFSLSILLCFGAGVLLSTSVIHMLKEIRVNVSGQYKDYVEVLFCCGYFIIYIVDEIFHYFYGEHKRYAVHGQSCDSSSTPRAPIPYNDHIEKQYPYNPEFYRESERAALLHQPQYWNNELECDPRVCNGRLGSTGLLVALSVHAVLEGLAVGLEKSSAQVMLILWAIATHKLVVGFCLGIEISSDPRNSGCYHFSTIVLFSLSSVTGIAIGIFITTIPRHINNLVLPLLQCLAGGTLLYITLSEVLPRERTRWSNNVNFKSAGLFQLIAVLIGFGIMSALNFYLEA